MSENRIMGLIGLAEKAGKTASGDFSVEQVLKARKAKLVILAQDASENTKHKFTERGEAAGCPVICLGNKEGLGKAIGKAKRACVAILDEGLAKAIRQSAERLNAVQGE